jgi:hypothetical protein
VLSNVTLSVSIVPENFHSPVLPWIRPANAGVCHMQKQVIEFGGEPVGIVIPDADRLKFIAVKYHVIDLDEQRFDTPDQVRLAIRELVRSRNTAPSAHV